MLFTSVTLCCLALAVQSQNLQNSYYGQFLNPDRIYFEDNRPQSFSQSPNVPDNDVIRRIFENDSAQQSSNVSPSYEIAKSNEIAFGTTVEQVTNKNTPLEQVTARNTPLHRVTNRNTPLQPVNRPATPIIPSQQTAEQHDLERQIREQPKPAPAPAPNNGYNNLLYSVTNFGVNLFKNANAIQPGNNVVVSPFSITTLLGLLQQGAKGQTQDQISAALQMTPANTASMYSQVFGDFQSRNSRNILKTANNLFIADGFTINQDFKKVAINNFSSDITPVSYARPDLAARQINSWVASRTDNKIVNLVSPDTLDGTTQVVLVNTIYFKGLWEVPFRVQLTLPREFHLSSGPTKTVQYMRTRKLFKTGVDPTTKAQIVILPFEGDQYSLMVILPSQLTPISQTLSTLTDARLLSYHSFSALDTELELPKFTIRSDTDLTPVLRNMGITNMFGQHAELSGVGTYQTYSPQISSAVHSAVLSIDEQGGSAAAATAFAAVALSYNEPSVVFKANRPFIAVLWDTKTALPLFMAKIEDPQL